MKLNFKTVLIIFLVALLGGALGTFGIIEVYSSNNSYENDPIVINEVSYTNKQENNYSKAIDKAYNTVVEIKCTIQTTNQSDFFFFGGGSQFSTASGSGVIISDDGYIVTNNHVVEGATGEDAVQVKLFNGEQFTAIIIGTDPRTDLAVLKIDTNGLQFASFTDSSELQMGEDVLAIGNPLGLGICCSNGIISALEKEITINNVYLTVIQTNAAVNAGNSGGGLFDLNGNLVGIVNAKKTAAALGETSIEGMGYAIPANTVKRIVADLVKNGYVKDRAALGVRVYTGDSYYSTNGVIITEVTPGGSADKAGLKANDIITSVDNTVVNSYADLSKVLDSKAVGDVVKITVNRNSEVKEFDVTLQQSVAN